jgi:hypothetical protein
MASRRRKAKPKSKAAPRKPVSQAQARLFGIVARKGAGKARKLKRGEMSRPEARSSLRGVPVSALRPKRQRTAAQRAATRKRNARRAAGL